MSTTLPREQISSPVPGSGPSAPGDRSIESPPPRATRERLLALDVFRGLTIAAMLLVNDPGSWGNIYPPLEHAAWNGWTPTDLIFPFFLFIVGITTHLSLGVRRERGAAESDIIRQILKRGALIFLFGLVLSGFPFFTWGSVAGVPEPSFWQRVVDRFAHLRYLGVLQRIAIAYVCAALLTRRTSLKQQVIIVTVLLYGYWFAMTLLPVPGTGIPGVLTLNNPHNVTLSAWIDRVVLGTNHTWNQTVTWDPEGPFSTLPAIATAMLGVMAGRWLSEKRPLLERLTALFAGGARGMLLGSMWGWSFPINKNLWTSSYVLFTAGMACTAIATFMWIIDVKGVRWWTTPFVVFGMNPITAYVGSGLMARMIYSVWLVPYQGKQTPIETVIYKTAFASWLEPRDASLLFALSFVLVWLAAMYILYRRRIFLKL
jgi:predicted acyltransferase